MSKFEFHAVFAISRMVIFEVNYYTLGDNKKPYFTTSAHEFNQPKTDWRSGGQGQERLLPKISNAYRFYKKWDSKHLHDLSDNEFLEMFSDMNELCTTYNFLYMDDTNPKWKWYKDNGFAFSQTKALSMIPFKKMDTNYDKTSEILN